MKGNIEMQGETHGEISKRNVGRIKKKKFKGKC